MNLVRKLIEVNESKWFWFAGMLTGSYMPIILRFIISLDNKDIPSFDIKDFLFAGLALNLSSFGIIGNGNVRSRTPMAALSIFCITVITCAIGVFLVNEPNTQKSFVWLKSISIFFVILSTGISYKAGIHLFN